MRSSERMRLERECVGEIGWLLSSLSHGITYVMLIAKIFVHRISKKLPRRFFFCLFWHGDSEILCNCNLYGLHLCVRVYIGVKMGSVIKVSRLPDGDSHRWVVIIIAHLEGETARKCLCFVMLLYRQFSFINFYDSSALSDLSLNC